MAWQGGVLERIGQIERDTVAEVDEVVQTESARLRLALDTERNYLRSVLEETAREIVLGGEVAAARAAHKAINVADGYRLRDEARAHRAELASIGCHDRFLEAAEALADQVLALEAHLAAPLARAKREATSDALPGLKRIVEDAAHRGAAEQRRALNKSIHAPEEQIDQWRRQMVDAVRHARTAAKERVDGTHRRARAEVERLVEELAGVPGPVTKRLLEVADTRVEGAVRRATEGRASRDSSVYGVFQRIGMVISMVIVFVLGTIAMLGGVGFASAAVGALMLRGAYAPPVMGGLLIGLVGCTLGALFTDVLFSSLGNWRTSVHDALLGAITPIRGGRPTSPQDLENALKYVELPPLSPDRVAAAATPGALRIAVRPGEVAVRDPGEVTGRIRIPPRHRKE